MSLLAGPLRPLLRAAPALAPAARAAHFQFVPSLPDPADGELLACRFFTRTSTNDLSCLSASELGSGE